jgi:hypothetical protein
VGLRTGGGASARRKRVGASWGPAGASLGRPAAATRKRGRQSWLPCRRPMTATERGGAGPRRQRRGVGASTCGGWWVERTSNRRIKQLLIKTQSK